jgi:hypothetical protein
LTHALTAVAFVVIAVHAMHADSTVTAVILMKMTGPKGVRIATKHFAALVGLNLEVKELNFATGSIVISIIGAMAVERIEFFKMVKVAAMKHAAATMLHLPSKNDSQS